MQTVNVLTANIRKVGIEMLRYLPNTISMIITFYAIFLFMFFGIQIVGDPSTAEASVQYLIVSNTFWFLSIMAMQGIGWEITSEATRGTLEQLSMSPMGLWKILLARMSGTILINLLIIGVMLFLVMATAGQWLYFDLLTIAPILLLTLISMVGVGFMVAGLSIIFKQIQAMLQILQFVFMALVFVPLSLTPLLELAPFVRGVDMIRQAMMAGTQLAQFAPLDFVLLVLNASIYFVLGVFIFRRCETLAMQRGLLGHY